MSAPNIIYASATPENNNSDGFGEYSTIDFVINAEGRKLLKNSVRIEGEVLVETSAGANPPIAVDGSVNMRIEPKIGSHTFFESWQVSLPQSKGVIQNAQEYPRYVNTIATASLSKNDYFCSDLIAELRGANEENGKINIQQISSPNANGTNDPVNPSFCIKPLICLNQMQPAGGDYSFAQNGLIKLSCNLARNGSALYGESVTGTCKYTLKNVVVRYITIPDDGSKQQPIMMNSYVSIKNSINSTFANISSRVPSNAVNGVTINFLKQENESTITSNSNALETLPQINEINYMFSDSTSNVISYPISDRGDMIQKGLESLRSAGYNGCSAQSLKGNRGFLVGLPFSEYTDLSKNKFSFQVKTDVAVGTYLCYLYFHSLVVV